MPVYNSRHINSSSIVYDIHIHVAAFLNCQAIFALLIFFFNIPSQDKSRELVIEMVLLG